MDPTLANLTLSDRVWVICERHRIAIRGRIVTVTPDSYTVKLPKSSLPPQRYDRISGMHCMDDKGLLTNYFFIRIELPQRFLNPRARPHYYIIDDIGDDDAQA